MHDMLSTQRNPSQIIITQSVYSSYDYINSQEDLCLVLFLFIIIYHLSSSSVIICVLHQNLSCFFLMHFLNLNAVVITTCTLLALSLPIMTTSTSACGVSLKEVYSSFSDSFELVVMLVDKNDKIDLQASTPLTFFDNQYVKGKYVKNIHYYSTNVDEVKMSLKNQKLIAFEKNVVALSD